MAASTPPPPAQPPAQPPRSRNELCRFEQDALLYRVYIQHDGEITFTVTGDPLRLGLVTVEDLRWDWDWTARLPAVQETSLMVNLHARPLAVLRTVALRLAQYLQRHPLPFFYWRITDDARRLRVYARLLQRHGHLLRDYEPLIDEAGRFVMFTHQPADDGSPA